MTGASLVNSHPPRLVSARASRRAYQRDCASQQIVHNFLVSFTLLYIIDVTRKYTPFKWNHLKISGNRSLAVKSKVDTLEIVLSSHFSLRFHHWLTLSFQDKLLCILFFYQHSEKELPIIIFYNYNSKMTGRLPGKNFKFSTTLLSCNSQRRLSTKKRKPNQV